MSKIGIRLSDASFYPILDDQSASRKKLVLTTVHNDQESVHIDLYKHDDVTDSDTFVGNLVIEGIQKAPKGEANIELELGQSDDGILSALARDLSSGIEKSLTLENDSSFQSEASPDFSLDDEILNASSEEATKDELSLGAESEFGDFSIPEEETIKEETVEEQASFELEEPLSEPARAEDDAFSIPDDDELVLDSFEDTLSFESVGSKTSDVEEISLVDDSFLGEESLHDESASEMPLDDIQLSEPIVNEKSESMTFESSSTELNDNDEFSIPDMDDFSMEESPAPFVDKSETKASDEFVMTEEEFSLPSLDEESDKTAEMKLAERDKRDEEIEIERKLFVDEDEKKTSKKSNDYRKFRDDTEETKPKNNKILFIILGVLGVVLLVVVFALLFNQCSSQGAKTPPVAETKTEAVVEAPKTEPAKVEPAKTEETTVEPVKTEPVKVEPAKTEPAKTDTTKKAKGVWYKIRWGDTLWDLANAYYRNPWLFRIISKANKIKNPDKIISGKWIWIPPK